MTEAYPGYETETAPLAHRADEKAQVQTPPTLIEAIFSLEDRVRLFQDSGSSASAGALWFFYLIQAGAGVFLTLNAVVLGTVAADLNRVCEDESFGSLLIAVSSTSLFPILALFALNYRGEQRPSLMLHVLSALCIITSITTAIIAQVNLCDGVWEAYISANWVLTSVLFNEFFVVRIPWNSFYLHYLAPLSRFFAFDWSVLETRASLLNRVFGGEHAQNSLEQSNISIKSVHNLIKVVFFFYAVLYTLSIFGIAQAVNVLSPNQDQDIACSDYAINFLVTVVATMVYLPLPFLVAFGRFPRLSLGLMFLLISGIVVSTALAEVNGDDMTYAGYYWRRITRDCDILLSYRWYLHFSWILLIPLFVDCITSIVKILTGSKKPMDQEPLL